jgi:plastocyanin
MLAMKNYIIGILAISLFGGAAQVFAHSEPNLPNEMTPEAAGQSHIIDIHKMKFQTPVLRVKIGDKITWFNKDAVPHTVTAFDKSWDSGRLKKGESFTLTISDETRLEYFCLYHRQMKAKITLN